MGGLRLARRFGLPGKAQHHSNAQRHCEDLQRCPVRKAAAVPTPPIYGQVLNPEAAILMKQLPFDWAMADRICEQHAGVDEAGRGPLAGPVFAAAVILDPARPIAGLKDSKVLSALQREKLFEQICAHALSFSIAEASALEIDQINILNATLLAMQRAVQNLFHQPALALVDGNQAPKLVMPVQTVVKGDALFPAISAASILAKVSRDRWCQELHERYPLYNFAQHKGYPTAAHIAALQRLGPCPEHRRSFTPVKKVCADRC
jgi:ribonuclease HII